MEKRAPKWTGKMASDEDQEKYNTGALRKELLEDMLGKRAKL